MTITVSSLHAYPLKSGHAINLSECEITGEGPKFDRQFMLVHDGGNQHGKFVSQRDKGFEKLALIKARIIDSQNEIFSFSLPQVDEIIIDRNSFYKNIGVSRVWKDECETIDAGDDVALFFSCYFSSPVRLVSMAPHYKRQVDQNFSQQDDTVNFADGFPILFTNVNSLKSLSSHFQEGTKIGMERFRPNIVLDGLDPFAEDHISKLQIGSSLIFEFLKPCARCVMTTIDQYSGDKPFENEPISTLLKYRKGNAGGLLGVFFGQNAILREGTGTVSVGDKVKILALRDPHPAVAQTGLRYSGNFRI